MQSVLVSANRWRRPGCIALALALVLPLLALLVSESAAQEYRPRRNFLQRLFLGNDYPEPPRQLRKVKPRKKVAKARRSKRNLDAAEAEVAEVVKAPDARIVLVVGDFLGSGLAEGLAAAYAQSPSVTVLDRTNGSSGFVRDDHFDWPGEIGPMIDDSKPAAVVIMLGSNDRQQLRIGTTREEKRTEAWNKEYEARATLFAAAVADKKVPLLWVGMPAFKSASMNSDMLAFNDIYRRVAESASGEFVDVWDGFVDENGAFVSSGPDINGQPVKLRSNDGINFTKAGKRKLAFYLEKPLSKILGDVTAPVAGLPAQAAPSLTLDPDAIAKIQRTVPVSLTDPELDGGAELLGLTAEPRPKARTPAEKLAIEGLAPLASPGRADDFGGAATAATTAAPAAPAAAAASPAAPGAGDKAVGSFIRR